MKFRLFTFLLLLGNLLFVTSTGPIYAQQDRTISVIPPRFELFANPGDTLYEQIRIRNESDMPVSLGVLVEDFTTSGEEGQVVLEEGEDTASYSLARWIEPESSELILQPDEERSIGIFINVPRDAEPGGHYASVLFRSSSDEQIPGAATITQRIGTLILLRVSGNVVEDAGIESFSVPSYMRSGPVTFSLRVKNNGNVHVRPEGTIIIENLFGHKVAELPLDSRNVIPGAIRKMDTTWDEKSLLGRYKATLVSTYGEGAQAKTLTSAVNFTVASPVAIAIIVVGGIAGIVLLLSLVSGRKRLSKALKVITKG